MCERITGGLSFAHVPAGDHLQTRHVPRPGLEPVPFSMQPGLTCFLSFLNYEFPKHKKYKE